MKKKVVEPKAKAKTYELARDDDGHWYVIPSSKSKAWYKCLDDVYNDDADGLPSWAVRLNGAYSTVKFEKYMIG